MRTPAHPLGPVPPGSGRSDPSGSHQGGGEPGPEPVDRELQAHPEHVEGPDEGRLVLGGSESVDGDGHGAPLAGIAQFELTRSYQAYRGPLPSPADFGGFEQVLYRERRTESSAWRSSVRGRARRPMRRSPLRTADGAAGRSR